MNNRALRVVGVSWHTAHQFELARLPFIKSYDLILNPYRRFWAEQHRPMPDNIRYIPHYEVGKYDLAILHIDQQAIYNPKTGDRITKGRIYNELNETIKDIPKVVINHMTPFHDKYDTSKVISIIKQMVGKNVMVCNSYEAQKQWGWGKTIIHGMRPDEWWDLPKEPRVVTVLSPAGMNKAYRRVFLETVIRILKQKRVVFRWINVDISFDSWDEYRDYLGRSLIYFNPTWQSPRPRARTEAMLSGCCVVTTAYQDADTFIEDGKNGFLTSRGKIQDPRIMDSPQYAADLIADLIKNNPNKALQVGQEGKKTAQKLFNHKVFAKQWCDMLNKEFGFGL